MSRPPRTPRPRRPSPSSTQTAPASPLGRSGRSQIIFVLLSALVVCSILIAAVATISFDGLFGESSDEQQQDYVDPNKDVISEQQALVDKNPEDFHAIALLANLLGNTGRLTEAIPYYEKALQLRPDDMGVRLDFARALADGNLRPDAEVQFTQIISRDPENQQAHYYLAELYRIWVPVRTDEAIVEYRKAIAIDGTTYMAQQAQDQLESLGVGSPVSSPGSRATSASAPGTEATP